MNLGKRGRPFAYADGLIALIGTFRLAAVVSYRNVRGRPG